MRIGYDATLLRAEPAGVEGTVEQLLRALVELETGDEFVVYCGRRWKQPEWLKRPNVRLHRMIFDSSWRLARIAWQQMRLPFAANSHRLDILHGPAYVLPTSPLASWMGVTTSLDAADAIALSHPELCRKSTVQHLKRYLPRSCRAARRVIAPTKASAAALAKFAGADPARVRVIPHGISADYVPIDDRKMLEQVRATLGLPAKYMLFVGQIEPKKNLRMLLRAFFAARSHRELPHKLLVVGKPAWRWREVYEEVRILNLADSVIFTGYLPQKVLPYVYNMAEALLMPSIVEGFGLPALEAAACGVPVLTSTDPAMVEVTGDAALHADAADLKALREAIERLALDAECRKRLAAAGPEQARQFTWKRAAAAHMDVFREIHEEDRREKADLERRVGARQDGGK